MYYNIGTSLKIENSTFKYNKGETIDGVMTIKSARTLAMHNL